VPGVHVSVSAGATGVSVVSEGVVVVSVVSVFVVVDVEDGGVIGAGVSALGAGVVTGTVVGAGTGDAGLVDGGDMPLCGVSGMGPPGAVSVPISSARAVKEPAAQTAAAINIVRFMTTSLSSVIVFLLDYRESSVTLCLPPWPEARAPSSSFSFSFRSSSVAAKPHRTSSPPLPSVSTLVRRSSSRSTRARPWGK
jgi:hypothetical protein